MPISTILWTTKPRRARSRFSFESVELASSDNGIIGFDLNPPRVSSQ